MAFNVMSYSPAAGMGCLDAPLGRAADGGLIWLRGSYALSAVIRFDSREAAELEAGRLAPHVEGGRVAVMPAAPLPCFDPAAHARLSRDEWMARAREARASGGTWGARTVAECVEGARTWSRGLVRIRRMGGEA